MFEVILTIFVIFIPILLVTFMMHIWYYNKALSSLKTRGVDVSEYYVEGRDYGSRGCVKKIKSLLKRAGSENFSNNEIDLLNKSKHLYYWPSATSIIIFLLFSVTVYVDKL